MKSQSYNKFWQRIHKSAANKGIPLRVMFELTYRCNFNCKHCYVPQSYREYGELETKEVFSILDQLKDIGCFYLGFTGGEPFLREDIIQILWYAKKNGFEVIIYTNGSLIDEEIANELQRIKPNKVDITIPAVSREGFYSVTRVSGSRDRVFRAVELLRKRGINLGFKTCLLKENESEIKDIENFTSSLGAQFRLDDSLLPCLDGSKEPYLYRGTLGEGCGNLLDTDGVEIEGCGLVNNSKQGIEDLFACGAGLTQAAITPLGELKMCLMIDYPKRKVLNEKGKGDKTDLKSAWKKMRESVLSLNVGKDYICNKCDLRTYCGWCPAKGWLENKNFLSCDPESRLLAEERKSKTVQVTNIN